MTEYRKSMAISSIIARHILYNSVFACCLCIAALTSCNKGGDKRAGDAEFGDTTYLPQYAGNFTIVSDADSATVIAVKNPWQGAGGVAMTYRVSKPAQRIVAMSSSFVAMLESLGEADRVVGVSGRGFISSDAVRSRVADVGYDNNIDFEQLVSLNPDMVLLYGVNGPNIIEPKLRELGIPCIYLGDYIEESPLGKAEWIVAVGEIAGCRERAIEMFDSIAERYNTLRVRFTAMSPRPKVMINAPYGDSWWMPSTKNYMAQLIADAGGEYIFKDNDSNSSAAIDMEKAYMLASGADVWIQPGQAKSIEELAQMVPRFTDTSVFVNKKIYNNNLRCTPGGGNDFYESGVMHPDIILEDLAAIFHPDSFPAHDFHYYRRL